MKVQVFAALYITKNRFSTKNSKFYPLLIYSLENICCKTHKVKNILIFHKLKKELFRHVEGERYGSLLITAKYLKVQWLLVLARSISTMLVIQVIKR